MQNWRSRMKWQITKRDNFRGRPASSLWPINDKHVITELLAEDKIIWVWFRFELCGQLDLKIPSLCGKKEIYKQKCVHCKILYYENAMKSHLAMKYVHVASSAIA